MLIVPGLGHELVDRAFVDRIRHRLQFGVARKHHSYGLGIAFAGFTQKLHPGHAGHALVRDDHVDRRGLQQPQPLLPAFGRQNTVTIAPQQTLDGAKDEFLIVNQQKGGSGLFHGADHGIGFFTARKRL